jgi:hypothetical protein
MVSAASAAHLFQVYGVNGNFILKKIFTLPLDGGGMGGGECKDAIKFPSPSSPPTRGEEKEKRNMEIGS